MNALGCISSTVLWIRPKFARVKARIVVLYGPTEDDEQFSGVAWDKIGLCIK